MRSRARPKSAVAAFATIVAFTVSTVGHAATTNGTTGAGGQRPAAPGLCLVSAPVAGLTVAPATGLAPLVVTADGSASTDSVGCTLSYTFAWGDGTADTGPQTTATAMHTFTTAGAHIVTLTVTDDATIVVPGTATFSVNVSALMSPTAALSVTPTSGTIPFGVTANASGSLAGTFPIASYTFVWGDGTPNTGPQAGSTAPHTYTTAGNHAVQVIVADNQTPAHTATTTAHVNASAPVGPTPGLTVTPPGGASPLTITADAASSTAGSAPITSYTFDFGDGTVVGPQSGKSAQHTYRNPGTYVVRMTIDDQNNLSASTSSQVVVTAPPLTAPTVHRAAGADRYLTAVAVSQLRWDATTDTSSSARHPGAVVMARGDEYPDALAGIPLASKVNGPLLLSSPADFDAATDAELHRILPSGGTVYILGGTSALSPTVEAHLKRDGYTVVRYFGADRFATALAIARYGLGNPQHVIVATGDDFPDALSAGPYAANWFASGTGRPAAVLLSDGASLPPAVAAYIKTKLVGSTNAAPYVIGIGGPGAQSITTVGSTSQFDALVGKDRYSTAAMVAAYFPTNVPVGVASGENFPDALTGGAMTAVSGGPVLLTPQAALNTVTGAALGKVKAGVPTVDVFGGPVAVSEATLGAIVRSVGGRLQ
jgi:putative cell wall-binding protein